MNDFFDQDKTLRGHFPGERVFDRYKLVRTLGEGGMGVVWLAHDEQLELDVALKFLPENYVHDDSAINDLKRETKKALKLTHANIVRTYDFLQNDQMVAVSMEHVDGQSLTQLRLDKDNQVFSAEQIEKWIGQVCKALDYAHKEAQIAHRDLKPSNLLIDSKGNLKITDFGISATISDATTFTQLNASSSGTQVYASPEQMMGDKPAPTDDIYSLGATIYDLLTSKPPFHSGRIDLQLKGKIPPLMKERRKEFGIKATNKIPQAWEDTVACCLAKAAKDRPQSLAKVWDGLHGKGNMKPPKIPKAQSGTGKKLLLVFCILLLISGAGTVGWYYGTGGFNKKDKPVIEENNTTPTVVNVDNTSDETIKEDVDKTAQANTEPPKPLPPIVKKKNTVFDLNLPIKKEEKPETNEEPLNKETPDIVFQTQEEQETPIQVNVPEEIEPPKDIPFPEEGPQPNRDWVIPNYNVSMVWISPGEFMMGERSLHLVRITKGFWLGSYEVTQDQWELVMGYNPSNTSEFSGNIPINQISWNDAMDFCSALTEIERNAGRLPKGYEYSLPTEAQWEYACKAGRNSFFSFGDRIDSSLANFNGKHPYGGGSRGTYRKKALPVGSFGPNSWGLYDMHGNISEWCYDWNGNYNLRNTNDPTGPGYGNERIIRGGAWNSDGEDCTSGSRNRMAPNSQNSSTGFRIALRKVDE